jgi:hypothetical protein
MGYSVSFSRLFSPSCVVSVYSTCILRYCGGVARLAVPSIFEFSPAFEKRRLFCCLNFWSGLVTGTGTQLRTCVYQYQTALALPCRLSTTPSPSPYNHRHTHIHPILVLILILAHSSAQSIDFLIIIETGSIYALLYRPPLLTAHRYSPLER